MPAPASALIQVGRGNAPVSDPGWPEGALAVANLKPRVGWWEGPPFGGGEWQFLYRGDTAALTQALTAFAAIRAPMLDLVLHDAPQENDFLKDPKKPDADARIDWTFTVWVPASWHRLFNNPKSVFSADHPNFRQPVDPPRLDVYVGGGEVDWERVKVPAGVHLRDERVSAADVTVNEGAMVRMEVFDMATGKPVVGARVTVARQSPFGQNARALEVKVAAGVSDASGRVQLDQIPAGTHRVSVEHDGYAPRLIGYERLREGTYKFFTVELAKAETLRGQVLGAGARPIKGATVRASNVMALNGRGYSGSFGIEATTGGDGVFELAGLPEGFTQLWASAPGYHYGDISTIYDVPTTNITLRMARGGTIHVTVTDKDGNRMAQHQGHELLVEVEPLGGARVGTWGWSSKVKPDGTVEFTEVPAGDYRITSRPNPGTTDRQYAPPQTVRLGPGVRAEVKVVYE